MDLTTTRWLSADVNGDRRSDLIHLRNSGIDTLLSNGNGSYRLAAEGFKPRPDYNMNVGIDVGNSD